jgi:hypothetical protein
VLVGRERELAAFLAWEASGEGEVLNVSGPGGVGKTALLGAFAQASTRPVIQVDGRVIEPTREALLAAVGDGAGALLIVDAFEGLGDLTRFVREELLPGLADTRVVIAGRSPLAAAWRGGERWPVRIRALPLNRLGTDEARAYLQVRGIATAELIEQILAACGGWPLALSLAADLVEQFGVRRLSRAPEWHLAVNALVEQLLDEAADPQLRALLEAGSVVRRFDEALLAALVGEDAAAQAFGALCRLSVVRATDYGLALHDDLRRLVADDLRWRRPERHVQLRLRALEALAERARDAPPEERGRLLHERLFLWEHEVVRSVLFASDEQGEVWVESARPGDEEELVNLHRQWRAVRAAPVASSTNPTLEVVWEPKRAFEWFRSLVVHPHARVRVARDRAGSPVGYSVVLAICEDTRAFVSAHQVMQVCLDAYLAVPGVPPLRERPEDADLLFLSHLGAAGAYPAPTRAALLRDFLTVLAEGGACLCSVDQGDVRELAEALGFEPVPGAKVRFRGARFQGYALDLRRIGTEMWLQGLLSGSRVPVGPGELERELQAVLAEWHDDRRVSESSLAPLGDVRELVLASLALARERCAPGQELALRALERAYVERTVSHERVADELHVSRATFYRLLPRGVGLVAAALPDAASRLRQG